MNGSKLLFFRMKKSLNLLLFQKEHFPDNTKRTDKQPFIFLLYDIFIIKVYKKSFEVIIKEQIKTFKNQKFVYEIRINNFNIYAHFSFNSIFIGPFFFHQISEFKFKLTVALYINLSTSRLLTRAECL